jgi:hypothetical protein
MEKKEWIELDSQDLEKINRGLSMLRQSTQSRYLFCDDEECAMIDKYMDELINLQNRFFKMEEEIKNGNRRSKIEQR